MATKSEKERLAVIEEQMRQNKDEHIEIKALVQGIDRKLDDFKKTTATKADLLTKADKEDFDHVKANQKTLNDRLWYVVITLIIMLIGGVTWFAKQYIMLRGGLN